MRSPNVFKYENRLAKTLVARGGLSAQEAIPAAQAAVEQVREPSIADLDAALRSIHALRDRTHDGCDAEALVQMYDAANRVFAIGGVFGLGELGQAAYSLCELITRFRSTRRFHRQMIAVHLDGLKLLRFPGDHSAAERDTVLQGLRMITASLA